MAKPELGIKRTCPNCGNKYYDLNRDPIVCPSCGTIFEVVTVSSSGGGMVMVMSPGGLALG